MTQSPGVAELLRAEAPAVEKCPEHALELRWFCSTEKRLVCAQCPLQGGCRGHQGRPLAEEAAERRNRVVDQWEKVQLQRASINKFVAEVLPEKKRDIVSMASQAREALIQRLSFIRHVCDSEEQRLLEAAQTEEERAHQGILTQEVHWNESLRKLDALRSYLVTVITATDCSLMKAEEDIFLRTEEAEGILRPQESKELSFNPQCTQSLLVRRLWASAALCWNPDDIHLDEKTVGPFLALSDDKRTLTFNPKKARKIGQDGPARFDHWPNALATESFCSGVHTWRVNVSNSCAYKLGVCYNSLQRKGAGPDARLGYNPFSWVISYYGQEFQFSHNNQHWNMKLLKRPAEIGVLVDFGAGELIFYDPDSCVVLHMHHETFTAPLYPVLAVADQGISLV